jgi:hypothetical protein
MPLWSANDDPTGKPNWSNTADVYGVDKTEAAVAGKGVSPGWVRRTVGTGGVTLSIVSGGTGFTNSSVITVDGVATSGVVNATANVLVGFSTNVAGLNVAVTSGQVNVTATGASLLTTFANGQTVFVYTNSSSAEVRRINQITNSTSMNVVGSWTSSNAAATGVGLAGVIQTIVPNNGGGSGFVNTSNVSFSASANGQNASITATIGGRGGRITYENMVYVKTITNDAEDTAFPDS